MSPAADPRSGTSMTAGQPRKSLPARRSRTPPDASWDQGTRRTVGLRAAGVHRGHDRRPVPDVAPTRRPGAAALSALVLAEKERTIAAGRRTAPGPRPVDRRDGRAAGLPPRAVGRLGLARFSALEGHAQCSPAACSLAAGRASGVRPPRLTALEGWKNSCRKTCLVLVCDLLVKYCQAVRFATPRTPPRASARTSQPWLGCRPAVLA